MRHKIYLGHNLLFAEVKEDDKISLSMAGKVLTITGRKANSWTRSLGERRYKKAGAERLEQIIRPLLAISRASSTTQA